ncbi:hypothetical protein [Microcella sp.]|uniref:hypothetical protein n=1 Tax=Microcella sp. TaxID=1913979 RepID=UPI00391BF230
MRGRRFAAGALATLALLLLPAAIMAHWATVQLAQTERFVAALAPLAENPAVQDRIIVEVTALVDDQLDISTVTAELLSGLGEALDLGPRAQDALGLVSEPIAAGIRALVDDVVGEVVRSPAFASAWAGSVEVLHAQSIRLLAGDPDSLLALDRDGTLSLPLGPIVAEVRAALVAQGVPFAAAIPEVDRAIVIAEVPNLALARVVYQLGISIGTWLPWICAGLLVGALVLSPRRPLMLRTLGVLAAVVTGLLAIGFAVGRTVLTALVEPTSSTLVGAVYDAVLGYATSIIGGLLALAVIAALVGWWLGASPSATATRQIVGRGLTAARAARATAGVSLGRLGEWMRAERVMVRFTLLALGALPALLIVPLSVTTVLGSAALVLGLLVVAEVLMSEGAAADALGPV